MNAEQTVFTIDDLRRHIFCFLRKEPYKKCQNCECVLEWDKGKKKIDYLEWATLKPYCFECFRNNFFDNAYIGYGCSIF
tara:strand:+ start:416 stop:652 length:237 start_codon:yes stop_codon:yes gene_type:complete